MDAHSDTTLVGLIIGGATLAVLLLAQAVAIAYWGGGVAARVKALETAAPVAAELSGILAGLVATVGALKEGLDRSERQSSDRFTDIERKLDDMARPASRRNPA